MIDRASSLKIVFSMVLLFIGAAPGLAGPWPRFRGPNGQGISDEKNIPVRWTPEDYNWKITLPGGGHSSPVVWSDHVFVSSGDQKTNTSRFLALRVSDGSVAWQKEIRFPAYRINRLNSYATGSPAVDAQRVYLLCASNKESIIIALDHQGQEIWKRTFSGIHSQHGPGHSVIVFGDLLVFNHEQRTGDDTPQSAWIALDAPTGRTRWTCPREVSDKVSYSTPCVYPNIHTAPEQARLIFTSKAHGISAVNPLNGRVAWEAKTALPIRVVSSPVIADGLLLGSCGQGSGALHLVAIRPPHPEAVAAPQEVYKLTGSSAPYVPTSLAKDGLLFTFHDRGNVGCFRAATGQRLWLEKPGGLFYGSPVWIEGRLYCINRKGEVVVLKAGDQYERLAVNPLGEKSHATPAVADGRMYLRTFSHLISVGGKRITR